MNGNSSSSKSRLPVQHSGSGTRAFLQQSRQNAKKQSSSTFFHDEGAEDVDLSDNLLKIARKSGVLNLANRSLPKIPAKVWKILELDDTAKTKTNVSLDNTSEDKWWEFVDLTKLILANNAIKCIPAEISVLCALQTLDAHDNQITNISPNIGRLQELQKIDFSHNQLKELPIEMYNLIRLLELKLNHNQLESLSKEIGQLSLLNQLDVSFNKLVSLPEDLGFLSFLTTLNISNNILEDLPHDFGGLTGLKELDASDNNLTTIPSSFSQLIHLEVIRLQNNKFEEIPSDFGCSNLRELYLQNNQIKMFESEVFATTRIELIDLRQNKISELQLDREHLEFLDRFYLDNNDISSLPDALALLPSLKHLTLEGNSLRGIRLDILKRGTQGLLKYLRGRLSESKLETDDLNLDYMGSPSTASVSPRCISTQEQLGLDIYKLKNAKALSLASKQIKSIEDQVFITASEAKVNKIDLSKNLLTQLPTTFENLASCLNELILDFNRFTSLPSCIASFSSLQFLSFQNNQVENLPEDFTGLTKLREINFGYNKFTTMPSCLYSLPALEIIIATNNKISVIDPNCLGKLSRLAVLDLQNNDIREVPPELGLLSQLRSLNIEGNAFRVPGYAVLSKGTESVLSFLRNRIQ